LIRIKPIADQLGTFALSVRESVRMNWPNWTSGWSDGYFGITVVMQLIWNAALIGLAGAVASLLTRRFSKDAGCASALNILKERYAKGDLSKDDFDRMCRDIMV
jgi:uncharacterized membrane protein